MKRVLVINVATDREETVPALSLSLSAYLPSSLTSFDTVQFDNTATHFSFCSSVPCLLCVGSYVGVCSAKIDLIVMV